jgi:outer membrane protein insertion porin family
VALRSVWFALALGLALSAPAGAEERRTVAVLPLVVHALEQHAYLREGLADMLASRLGQQPGIAVVRVADPARATTDPAAARAAGQAAGAQWVLFGSFTRFGEGASLDVQCIDVAAPGKPGPRSIFVQSGLLADLIPRLDGVAERVAAHVLGRDAPAGVAGSGGGAGRAELDELRRRVDALERRGAPSAAAPAPPSGAEP